MSDVLTIYLPPGYNGPLPALAGWVAVSQTRVGAAMAARTGQLPGCYVDFRRVPTRA